MRRKKAFLKKNIILMVGLSGLKLNVWLRALMKILNTVNVLLTG
jgi:hypothetical protein